MADSLSKLTGKTVLVSIPTLFADIKCRPCTLMGAEINGLWLRSDELIGRLLPSSHPFASAEPLTFVPFTHVAAVLVATVAPGQSADAPAQSGVTPPAAAGGPQPKGGKRRAATPRK